MEIVVGSISLSCELYSLSWSCFRSCGVGTIVYGVWCFVCMCSAVGVAWLAQNIRHSSTRVGLRPVAFGCLQFSASQTFLVAAPLERLLNLRSTSNKNLETCCHSFIYWRNNKKKYASFNVVCELAYSLFLLEEFVKLHLPLKVYSSSTFCFNRGHGRITCFA